MSVSVTVSGGGVAFVSVAVSRGGVAFVTVNLSKGGMASHFSKRTLFFFLFQLECRVSCSSGNITLFH